MALYIITPSSTPSRPEEGTPEEGHLPLTFATGIAEVSLMALDALALLFFVSFMFFTALTLGELTDHIHVR